MRFLFLILTACAVAFSATARLLPETFLSCQVQFYPLSETPRGMISRWHDVPLLLDNSLPKGGARLSSWSTEQMEVSCRELKGYGFDAFSFFPDTYNRLGPFDLHAEGVGADVKLVPILAPNRIGARYSKEDVMGRVIANRGLELNGRQVIYAYKTVAFAGKDPAVFAKAVANLRQDYGDRFLFMADMEFLTKYRYAFEKGPVPASDVATAKEEVRRWLRVADGAYYGEVHMLQLPQKDERVFFADFYRDFVIRLLKEVLDEPEFKGRKLLGLAAFVGHENNGQWGYYCSHDGTKTLRNSFAAACDAQPDYINFCEWDEWNENTSICPTIRSARTTKRILRSMFDTMRGRPLSPLDGDDPSVPNLILSSRAVVAYGELLKVEVLNVPDGAAGEVGFTLSLLDEQGTVVKSFARETLPADELKDRTYEIASEELALRRVVRYRLETEWKDVRRVWEDGLQFTELRTAAGWHCRWNKTPLRDLASGANGTLVARPERADGLTPVGLAYSGDEDLAYLSLWEGDEIVEACDSSGFEGHWRETASNYVFAVNFFSPRDLQAPGTIEVVGADGTVEWRDATGKLTEGPRTPLGRVSNWCADTLIRIGKGGDLSGAALKLATPDIGEVTIPLAPVVRFGTYVAHAQDGITVAADRYRFQRNFPARHLGVKSVRHRTDVLVSSADTVLGFEAVTGSGKIWRSRPVHLKPASSGEKEIVVRSALKAKAVRIRVSDSAAPVIRYDFSDAAGDLVLNSDGGRYRRGVLGAPAAFATFANRHYGYNASNPFLIPEYAVRKSGDSAWGRRTVPLRLDEGGRPILRFEGRNVLLLPQGVLPRTAGWTLKFRMRPKSLGSLQTPFACRWGKDTPGSFWMTMLEDGRLRLDYAGLANVHTRQGTPGKVRPGDWNEVTVRYGVDTIQLELNGERSPVYPCVSPGRFDLLCMVGGYEGEWFVGDIADLEIKQGE